jgi:hypothetical protein
LALYAGAAAAAAILIYDNYRHLAADTGANNVHALQADAFLHGRLTLDRPLHDTAVIGGKIYSHFPPFPALVLMPFVAAFGLEGCNPFAVKLLLTVLNVFTLRSLLGRAGVTNERAWWLTAGFLAGTGYWGVVVLQGVWYFSQVVAVTCLLLAIWEGLGRARGVLAGVFLGCAILSRQVTVYSAPFVAALLWVNFPANRARRALNLVGFGAALVVLGCGYLAFNYARYGNPLESGYAYLTVGPVWTTNIRRHGMFSPAYVPFNLLQMFAQGFHFDLSPDQLKLDRNGTSLTFASPFVFLGLWGRWRQPLTAAAWFSAALALGNLLLYYSNGWAQQNAQRYTLDFLPVLLPLIGLGMGRVQPALWKAAIAYSVLLNFVGMIVLPRAWSLLTRVADVAVGP